MSDDGTEAGKALEQQTSTERAIGDFLAKVKASGVCPMCNNTRWLVAWDEKYRHHFIPSTKDVALGVSVYLLACTNCGFTRSHLKRLVDGHIAPVYEENET